MELTITRLTINKVNLKKDDKNGDKGRKTKLKYANVGDNSEYKVIRQQRHLWFRAALDG